MKQPQKLTKEHQLFQSWKFNPEKFVRECIGAQPSTQQKAALDSVKKMAFAKIKSAEGQPMTEEERRLSKKIGLTIKSGRGTGKDTFLSWVYIWLLTCFPFAQGLVTAPTSHQLRDVLWKEIAKWLKPNKILSDALVWQTERVFNKDYPETWFITARTANVKGSPEEQAETLSGLHGPYMILAADEASGVPHGVFSNLEATLTDKMNFVILISNPTRGSGYFFESHNKYRDFWECFTWNTEDSDRPELGKDYIEIQRKKYPVDSNMYRINVLGEFPIADSRTLIPWEWIQNAVERELEIIDGAYILKGIDVGAGGDKTVIVTRQGNVVTDITEYDNADTMKVVGWIMSELADDNYDMAFIDPIGLGAGVYDRLMELKVARLYPVDVRGEADDPSCFRVRDSLFWKLREQFEKGTIKIPDEEELIGELSTICYDVQDSKGLTKMESKKDMRKRGLASPNKADALALTYYFGDRTYKSVNRDLTQRKPDKPLNWRVA